ncbi:MAG: hypothetical protein WC136_11930 [Sphaerochaeta sp.]|jgi:hypothetical protein
MELSQQTKDQLKQDFKTFFVTVDKIKDTKHESNIRYKYISFLHDILSRSELRILKEANNE